MGVSKFWHGYNFASRLDEIIGLVEGFVTESHQIGDDEGDASGNPCHAVHQHIAPFSFLVDELVDLLKIVAYVETLVVNSRHIQVLDVCGYLLI